MSEIEIDNLSHEAATAYIMSLQEQKQQLEKQMAELEAKAAELEQQSRDKDKEIQKLQVLSEMLAKARKKIFGQSSEQIQYINGSQQLDFFNEAELCSDAAAPEPGKNTPVKSYERKPKRTKAEMLEGVEHQKVWCDPPKEELICPECGKALQEDEIIGEKFLYTGVVIIPRMVCAVDFYTHSYKCSECEEKTGKTVIVQGKAPEPIMAKSMATPSSVASVMIEKFDNCVPLYRQEQYWKSIGVDLRRNTMANWIIRGSQWFVPIWNILHEKVLSSDIINADETSCHVLKEDGRTSKQVSRMWVLCSQEWKIALYKYHPTRAGKVADELLHGFTGYLQTDGCSSYNTVKTATHIGCWAHARRKWVDCFPKGIPEGCENDNDVKGLRLIEEIFSVDKSLSDLPPEQRYKERQEKLKPVLDRYWNHLESFKAENDSGLLKAQNYSLNHKEQLNNILLDGRLELTNNLAERTVKPFVMARKNFLFADTSRGADASALCFSMIETAKRNGLNPFGYLLYLLRELPKLGHNPTKEQLYPFLPWSESLPSYCKGTFDLSLLL